MTSAQLKFIDESIDDDEMQKDVDETDEKEETN